jgi:two-component system capsular synthesis sensor histidine kinase RcsC
MAAAVPQTRFRYMIVDDLLIHRKGIERLVNRALIDLNCSFICDTAESGADALSLCAQNVYHLAIIDYNMPQMNGAETTRKILEKQPHVYIVGCTASTASEDIQDCLDAGMKKVLPKDWKQVKELVKGLVPAIITDHA